MSSSSKSQKNASNAGASASGLPTTAAATKSKVMGRPRIFDEEKVLNIVIEQFWLHGFDGTTFSHLTKATGLHKGSLYQAFGDKKSLFIKALKHYLDQAYHEVLARVDRQAPPWTQLRTLLGSVILQNNQMGEGPCGCLAVNTMVELSPMETEVMAVLEAGYSIRMQTLSAMINEAQACGDVDTRLDAVELAQMICTLLAGMSASIKGPLSIEEAQQIADNFLLLIKKA
jgi:TetR/AcrR family transcriptional repressor of nem operon